MSERRALVSVLGRVVELPAGDTLVGAGPAAPVDAMSITYTSGRVTSVTEDGVTTTITYDGSGRVSTVSYPHGALTRTETYTYNPDGTVAGMTAAEA